MKTLMLAVMFLLIGAFFVISENHLALKENENIGKFFGLYNGWLSQVLDNAKGVTGYIVKMDWLPNQEVS